MALQHCHLLSVLLILSVSSSLSQQTLHPTDLSVLHDLHSSLRDLPRSKFFSSWDFSSSTGDPCTTFAGVVCSPDDESPFLRVSVLMLGTGLSDSPGLTGRLPPSISNLTSLTDLVLYPGQVSDTIPTSLGFSLRKLRLLSLSNNLLTGPVPDSLTGLPDLHTLDLSNNRLSGTIPSSLFLNSSPNLKVLILSNNGGLNGEIPSGFSSSQILHLDLSRNSIHGTLPQLPNTLKYLSVSDNSMSGTICTAFGTTIPDLTFLDLSMNAFSGEIPSNIFSLSSLSSVFLQRNNFSGTLTVPAVPSPLTTVDLSHNSLTGEIPVNLASTGTLYINSNRFMGSVPNELVQSIYTSKMSTFYAQHNFLTGFESKSDPLPESVSLCLSYNCMELPLFGSNCPVNAGPLQSRPPEQCENTASTGGD